jgi:membrane protein implicated in regulation of membrane protease activity
MVPAAPPPLAILWGRAAVARRARGVPTLSDWLIWLIVAGVLVAAEVGTLTLALGMAATGALAAFAVALAGAPGWAQLVVFIVVTAGMLAFVRPVARRHMVTPRALRTGTAALVGRTGTALDGVDHDGGRIRLAGEVWSARAWDEREVIPAGARVEVIEIDGATALVTEVSS